MGRDFRTAEKPALSKYRAETLIVLSQDEAIGRVAIARAKKWIESGKKGGMKIFIFGKPIDIPEEFTGSDTRVIIFAHGDESSKYIGNFVTAKQLASNLLTWSKGKRFGRVALHACYAGGNRTSQLGFKVKPKESFAYDLASRCGFVDSISAKSLRNVEEFVSDDQDRPTWRVHTFVLEEGGDVANRREMSLGDKAIFYPDPEATPLNVRKPRVEFPKFA